MKLLERETSEPMDTQSVLDRPAATSQPQAGETVPAPSVEVVSALVVDVVPLVMRSIRSEMRSQRAPGMSVPQFRTLTLLDARPGATLSEVAEHVGIGLPSTSKLVDSLVERGLVSRESALHDRRCLVLTLTGDGHTLLQTARRMTAAHVAERLKDLSSDDLTVVARAMAALRLNFSSGRQSNEE